MDVVYETLVSKLINVTKERLVDWQKSSSEDQYRLELNAASFVLSRSENPWTEFKYSYEFSMYNVNDVNIDIVNESDNAETRENHKLMEDLYDAVEYSCRREIETLENVLKELNQLDSDLPF